MKFHREVPFSLLSYFFFLLLLLPPHRMHLKGLALETLIASLASTHRLPPHRAVSSSGLLLSRAGTGTLSAHGPGTREGVVAASTADVNHAGGCELGGCWLWGDL